MTNSGMGGSRTAPTLLWLVIAGTLVAGQDHPQPPPPSPPARAMAGLGTHHHTIATTSPEAQRLFDQGLMLLYGFNHGQAIRMFQRAAELDPTRADAALGHRARLRSEHQRFRDGPRAREDRRRVREEGAGADVANGTARERAYIEALSKRYSSDPAADLKKLQVDYKDAMAALATAYPDDLDAQTLYAESLMDLRPWQLWTRDGKPSDVTGEVMRVLESVLKRSPLHPGREPLLHPHDGRLAVAGEGARVGAAAGDAGARGRSSRAHAGAHLRAHRATSSRPPTATRRRRPLTSASCSGRTRAAACTR